jgi:peroxiredoxin
LPGAHAGAAQADHAADARPRREAPARAAHRGRVLGRGVQHLAEVDFDSEFGARPLRRAIQRELENEVSRLLLSRALQPDDRVRVDYDGDRPTFDIDKGGAEELARLLTQGGATAVQRRDVVGVDNGRFRKRDRVCSPALGDERSVPTAERRFAGGHARPGIRAQVDPSQSVRLGDFGGRRLIMAFYPADWSPVCTDQMALYNEILPEFQELGAALVGISIDHAWCHVAFAQSRNLHFPLLAESHGSPIGVNPGADGILAALESMQAAPVSA